jgi:hypothetical protein
MEAPTRASKGLRAVREPKHAWKLHAREPGDPVYLHYAFDLWAQHWRKHRATGDVIIVRYADDIVMGFEQRADAEWVDVKGSKLRPHDFARAAYDLLRIGVRYWLKPQT